MRAGNRSFKDDAIANVDRPTSHTIRSDRSRRLPPAGSDRPHLDEVPRYERGHEPTLKANEYRPQFQSS
jgi:hypothetical protein